MIPSFFRFYFGFFFQILPLTWLVAYPLSFTGKVPAKRIFRTLFLLMHAEGIVFGILCLGIQRNLPSAYRLELADVVFLLCLLPQIVYYFRVLVCPAAEKIFLLFYGLICGSFTASVVNIINALILVPYRLHPMDEMPYSAEADILLLIFGSVMAGMSFLLLKRFYLPIREMATRREFRFFSFLSVILFIIVGTNMMLINYVDFYNPASMFLMFALFVAVTLLYIICFLMFKSTQEKYIAENQLLQLEHNLELGREQYKKIFDMVEQNRKIQHDFRHHVVALKGLMEEKKYEEAIRYVNRYADSIEAQGYKQYCSHPVINNMINYYSSKCMKRGIAFSAHMGKHLTLMKTEQLNMNDTDLAVVLGNLLENALAAASETPDSGAPFIRLNMFCQGSALVITTDNSFGGRRQLMGSQYHSTKENHTGIGLSSIRTVAEKYDGGAEFSHEEGIFHASVMLSLSVREGSSNL